jgi:hypothetical protein
MRIKTLAQLAKAAADCKSVVIPHSSFQRSPAAFIFSLQASMVHRYITSGMFIYKPRKKKPTKLRWTAIRKPMPF